MVKSVGLIIATHNGTQRLREISNWIANQSGFRGYVIVITSGESDIEKLKSVCEDKSIKLICEAFLTCGHSKRNRGADIAHKLGLDYVTFLNDYQILSPLALKNFEIEDHSEAILFGQIEFITDRGLVQPRISNFKNPLNKYSSRDEIWAIFSSVSESGMLIRTDIFISLGGWQYPTRKNKVYLGGDGMLLAAKVFVAGFDFAYSSAYQVYGGHRNLRISKEMAISRTALYPFAFTLSTKMGGVPNWVSRRFLLGRIFRFIQECCQGTSTDFKLQVIEISARIRALVGVGPSRKSKISISVLEENCELSHRYCAKRGARCCS